ncbi:hypothetical protein SAMN05660657_04547 [Geodermatophilus amargosae]|uniref:DUF559 domain-containing protein n=1 Tax=Geodermatophilus amargosae TaxID=1296565 RepID=A0A1I7CJ62_9ACTN|nr:hypothetical protein [Geodermatophilus amargosae]SFT99433.1 hypothetical protein SAMN05660657_04547 [Geodermatophilus amargosae]
MAGRRPRHHGFADRLGRGREHHVDGVQIVRDGERHARLLAAGWRVIRLGAADLRAPDAVVQRVRAALATW